MNFVGRAKKIDDIDLPVWGKKIGVGEDEIHAVYEAESRGGGFDSLGRPKILFEPHIFDQQLTGLKQMTARNLGLAYPRWRPNAYQEDSYMRLSKAIKIDETAALKACSWGAFQILGKNHTLIGYSTVQGMVRAFMEDEEAHLAGMVDFIAAEHLDDELRQHNWAGFARGYNGPGYAANGYDRKLATAYAKWSRIRDTPLPPPDKPLPQDQRPTPQILPPNPIPQKKWTLWGWLTGK